MIVETLSAHEPSRVSVEHVRGATNVWLRDNVDHDVVDMPDGGSQDLWRADEVAFSVPGTLTSEEVASMFDSLWSEHENDGRTASEVAAEALGAAREAKDEAARAGTDPQLQALARMQVATMDLSDATCDEVVAFRDYWPEWRPDTAYKHNQPFTYQGRYFRASRDLTSQAIYPPGTAESEYYEVELAADGIIVWYEVGGEYNMVHKGEKRHFPDEGGPVYEALEDTSYSPDAYPQHWKLVGRGE